MKSKIRSTFEWVRAAVLILFASSGSAIAPAQIAVYRLNICEEWSAWYNTAPAGPKTLHVKGVCTFHSSGYEVKLIRRKPQSLKPESCTLDVAITAPIGIGGIERGIRHMPVHYSEESEKQYDSVSIEPDHVIVAVKIQ